MRTSTTGVLPTQLATQGLNDRNQPLRIDQPVEIRERALADLVHRDELLCLLCLAKVFDRPQRANRRIVECQQIGHENIVQEQPAVSVRVLVVQLLQLLFKQPHILRSDQLLGPDFRRFRRRFIFNRLTATSRTLGRSLVALAFCHATFLPKRERKRKLRTR